ncbi:MAG: nucleoside 2-deoxyribosyltransferase domain-containing protein [Alphaproteobacteria bacterium]
MRVFLGGTCNESNWRNRIICMFNSNVKYFNPVVEDWTPDCMAEEIKQRDECDIILYVITAKMTGTYAIAEAVDDSNKRPKRTIFVRLKEDDKKFDEGQWRSLGAVAQMIEQNGASVYTDLKSASIDINKRCD